MTAAPQPEIPDSIEAASAGWLSAVLTERRSRVSGVSFDRVGAGVGLMGELARVEIEWEEPTAELPPRVVVKLPGADAGNRATAQILGLYEREVRFYLELADQLPVRTPRCFHAAYEPNPQAPDDPMQFERNVARLPIWLMRLLVRFAEWLARRQPLGAVLVLEDLGDLRPGDQLHGGDARDWGRAIDALAQLHVAGWENEAWLSSPWLARMRPNVKLNQALFSRQYRRLPPAWADRLDGQGRRLGDWLATHGVALMSKLGTAPDTLCHADYRLDNLFFDDDRNEVVMLDWQLPTRCPGVLDLAYFLSGVLGPDVDVAGEEAWVRRYHERIVEGGVRDYAWSDCQADYRRAHLAIWQRCIASATSVETGDARGVAMLESWWDRMQARLEGIDADAVLHGGAIRGSVSQ